MVNSSGMFLNLTLIVNDVDIADRDCFIEQVGHLRELSKDRSSNCSLQAQQ